MPKVAIVMGSNSDLPILEETIRCLKNFKINVDVHVLSAHRTPDDASQFAKNARAEGIEVIIAAAGKAAHLPGVIAAYTTLPVIGLPIKSSFMDGLDSLLSIVQMPPGIPVATVAVNGGDNAAILAAQILALKYPELQTALEEHKQDMVRKVRLNNETVRKEVMGE